MRHLLTGRGTYRLLGLSWALLLLAWQAVAQAPLVGHWVGHMTRVGSPLPIALDFSVRHGQLTGTFASSTQWASGIPLDSVVGAFPVLAFRLPSEPATSFVCTAQGPTLTRTFRQPGYPVGTLTLSRRPAPPRTYGLG